jgi:hypothetical protein
MRSNAFVVLPFIEGRVMESSLLTAYHQRAEVKFAEGGEEKDFLSIIRLKVLGWQLFFVMPNPAWKPLQ